MKKVQTTLILMLITLDLLSQATQLIEKKFKGSKQISECYYVLKSEVNKKHGEYILYFKLNEEDFKKFKKGYLNMDDYVKEKGTYIEGKKNGKWIEFSKPSVTKAIGEYKDGEKEGEWIEYIDNTRKKMGNYTNGKKTGIWNTLDLGTKVSSYNYDEDIKVGIWLTNMENGQVITRFDYDNNAELPPIINTFIKYPAKAREQGIEGTVTASYQINSDCTISNIIITKSLSLECDAEVTWAIEKMAELLKKYSTTCESSTETKDFNFNLN
jgi:antitoxin component YwqK of YwqJK toxin-antitoxin module